ncbi:unnamed protein product [Fusarium graminearum]|nr:unnamed protein product [Fusarium graminearum]
MAKTYNSGDSLVVTDPTTNPPVSGLTMGERTGSRIFHYLWSLTFEHPHGFNSVMELSQSPASRSIIQRATGRNKSDAVVELETAVARFQAHLKDDERKKLQGLKATPHDIQAVIIFTAELDRSDPKRRGKSVATRLSSFLQTIQQFFPAIDTFVSSNPDLAALIWGSVRLTFVILSNFVSYFESFVELLHGFGGLYSRFSEYQLLFKTSTELRDSICQFNTAIITCCQQIVILAHRPTRTQIVKAFTSSFQSEMRQYVDAVKTKAENVQRDIELVKAKTDRHEQKMQEKERQEASVNRSLVVASLSKTKNQVSKFRKDARKESNERKQRQTLDGLSTYNRYTTNLNSARNKRHLHTASWIFEKQEFKDWYTLKEAPVLHIAGKSEFGISNCLTSHMADIGFSWLWEDHPIYQLLRSSIIEFINNKQSESEVVSFFFSRFDDSESLQCDTILRSLVFQLASRRSLTKIVESKDLYSDLELAKRQSYSRDSLKRLFHSSLELIEKWFMVLDGIDECDADERRGLFGFLSDLLENENASGKVKLLLSCRETLNHDITTWFSLPLHVVTGSKTTSQDILTYAEDILREKLSRGELVLGDINLAQEILRSISLKEQGMFLWAFLTIEDLCSRKCDSEIIQALETLPSELNTTLDRALERIFRHKNADIAQAIFRWTAAVREPLKVNQLQEALSIKLGDTVIDPRSRINGIEKLTQWCENLVRIDEEDDAVCFSHHSILDYLSKTDSGPWKDFHIDQQGADHHVGQVCLTYLNIQSPSTALQHTRDERPSDPFQRMNFPVITQQVAREFAPGGFGARASKLIDYATQLKETTNTSRFSGTQAVVDVEYPFTSHFPFLRYAEKYWQTHIRFLTSESESYRLLVGMVEGSLLAHKMPWMDEKWRSSVIEIMLYSFELSPRSHSAPFYAMVYANSSGSHNLICQATKIIGRNPNLSNQLDTAWIEFLVKTGHLECPGDCVGMAQQHVGHYNIIRCATRCIANGVPNWPALVANPEIPCNCPNDFMERGVSEDVHFVLVDGYRRSSRPLLQIFARACSGVLTKKRLDLLSQESNLTALDLLRARTISGKSILDCVIEEQGSLESDYNDVKPILLLDILGRENITAYAREIGFGLDELRDLLSNGILWAYRKSKFSVGDHLSTIIQTLTISNSYRVTYILSIFDIAERIIRENTYRYVQELQAKKLVEFYLQSANHLAQFPQGSVVANFEQTLKARNWILAKALAYIQPQLTLGYINPGTAAFFAFLSCSQCKVEVNTINWQLTLCHTHHQQARRLSQSWTSSGKDSGDDECMDLLKQLEIEGSLMSYLGTVHFQHIRRLRRLATLGSR